MQAFALPVLQIVHEALRRAQQGHAARGSGQADTSGEAGKGSNSAAPSQLPPCVMSTEDRDAVMAVAPDGLAVQSRSDKSWGGGRATLGAFAGKVYYEVRRWSTQQASIHIATVDAETTGSNLSAKVIPALGP